MLVNDDILFPADPDTRAIARQLFAHIRELPLICPHGHIDPAWLAQNQPFCDPASLLVVPDHYIFRMLYSQGIRLEKLGVPTRDGSPTEADARQIWRLFAEHYHLFAATPTRVWLDMSFASLFGFEERLSAGIADVYFDRIADCLAQPEFAPRALYERFNIAVIATTESPLDALTQHRHLRGQDWSGRMITTYRPDAVVDPEFDDFTGNLARFAEVADTDIGTWDGYLEAHRVRRAYFRDHGATATDHGHPSAATADLPKAEAQALYAKVCSGNASAGEAELFRAQMLTEMAAMSLEDGMVMQIHPGSRRNHNAEIYRKFGRDMGADIPQRTDYVAALKPLLDRFGNAPDLTIILFTLDETAYGRELAPLAGHYPALRLGPPWWFFDSPEGMRRFREITTETAGFANTAGFNDDTRAFASIPARHDVARRIDCAYLADLVVTHRLEEDEAAEIAAELAHGLAKRAYKL